MGIGDSYLGFVEFLNSNGEKYALYNYNIGLIA